jgi:hypothetical protein
MTPEQKVDAFRAALDEYFAAAAFDDAERQFVVMTVMPVGIIRHVEVSFSIWEPEESKSVFCGQ